MDILPIKSKYLAKYKTKFLKMVQNILVRNYNMSEF